MTYPAFSLSSLADPPRVYALAAWRRYDVGTQGSTSASGTPRTTGPPSGHPPRRRRGSLDRSFFFARCQCFFTVPSERFVMRAVSAKV